MKQSRRLAAGALVALAMYAACVVTAEDELGSVEQADTVIATPLSDEQVAQLVFTGHALHEVRVRVTNQGSLRPLVCRMTAEQWKIPTYIWNPGDGLFPDRGGWYTLNGGGEGSADDGAIEWRMAIATAIWFPMVNHFRFTVDCKDASGAWVSAGVWSLDVPPSNADPLFTFNFTVNLASVGSGSAPPAPPPQPTPQPGSGSSIVVPVPPPPVPTGHCSCNVTCTGHFFSTWVDVYGIAPDQCHHESAAVQAAESATCPNWGVGTKRQCNWVN